MYILKTSASTTGYPSETKSETKSETRTEYNHGDPWLREKLSDMKDGLELEGRDNRRINPTIRVNQPHNAVNL